MGLAKTMKVDITGASSADLMSFLQQYPNGNVIVENGLALWEYNDTPQIQKLPPRMPQKTPQYASVPPSNQARGPNQPQTQQKNKFLNMFDTMASYF